MLYKTIKLIKLIMENLFRIVYQHLNFGWVYILSTTKMNTMAMSKKIMERKERDRKEKITELEKMAASGSGDAKKKLAKEKRKLK